MVASSRDLSGNREINLMMIDDDDDDDISS